MAERHRAGLRQRKGDSARALIRRPNAEWISRPDSFCHQDRHRGHNAPTVAALQFDREDRRLLGASPDIALVPFGRDEVHAPAIEPPILYPDFALAADERDLLRLTANERLA